jgi:hypothetical protein
MTLTKAVKWGIALGPNAAYTFGVWNDTHNPKSTLNAFQIAYSGYDVETGQTNPAHLVRGYLPLLMAWIFGKVAGRVLR